MLSCGKVFQFNQRTYDYYKIHEMPLSVCLTGLIQNLHERQIFNYNRVVAWRQITSQPEYLHYKYFSPERQALLAQSW